MENLHAGIVQLAESASGMATPHIVLVEEASGKASVRPIEGWAGSYENVLPVELQRRVADDANDCFPSSIVVATIGPTAFSVYKAAGKLTEAEPPSTS